jgi:hypothetical protein
LTLFGVRNYLHKLASKLPLPFEEIYTAPYHLAGRLMIGLHLLDGGAPQIPDQTVAAAVMLARHYGPRQICTSKDANAEWMEEHSFQPKVVCADAA